MTPSAYSANQCQNSQLSSCNVVSKVAIRQLHVAHVGNTFSKNVQTCSQRIGLIFLILLNLSIFGKCDNVGKTSSTKLQMSVLHTSDLGFFISHEKFIEDVYRHVKHGKEDISFQLRKNLFEINSPYSAKNKPNLKRKCENASFEELRREIKFVNQLYESFRKELSVAGVLALEEDATGNEGALQTSRAAYDASGRTDVINCVGRNELDSICTVIKDSNYLFPANCKFYCKDVKKILGDLQGEKYDLILLDPPWWNKYIRRVNSKTNNAYKMIYNEELKAIPIEDLIEDEGMVVVWCTNSNQHVETLREDIFKKWNVEYLGKWYWLKVTKSGLPICKFSEPPCKQPFEQIIFGSRKSQGFDNFEHGKLLVSVPSALHSHKPPLLDVLQVFFPNEPKCLEVFARYLLPNWTSYGLESLRFQHESLYETVELE